MDKTLLILSLILPISTIGLFVVNIVTANHIAGYGKELATLDNKAVSLTAANELLSQEIASASALLVIEQKARALGFVERTSRQVIAFGDSVFSVALKPHN